MTYQNRDPGSGRMAPVQPRQRIEPDRATPRQALWSVVVAAVVVFILAVVFYGINAADQPQTAAIPSPATTSSSTGSSNTANSSTSSSPAKTTGQGGAQNKSQPASQKAQ